MSEQVVVICSSGEQESALDLCATLEEQGLTCWSPEREEDPEAALWTLPSKLRSTRAMVLVTWDAAEHADAIESAAQHKLPVVMAVPGGDGGKWDSVLRELADALGLSKDWLQNRSGTPVARPRTHLADDEEEFLEFVAENVSEAQVFVRFGIFGHAIKRLEKVFTKAPRNLEAHDELLKIYLEDEDWKNAAATAADFLDCLRFREDDESYAILRTHLSAMGFIVDDGPPVAVGFSDVEPIPTRFFDKAVTTAPTREHEAPRAAPASHGPPSTEHHESGELELPVLRNFKSSQPVFQADGVESELSGVDFFIDHGMLDEARMRIGQLDHENPDHPGVAERKARIASMGVSGTSPGIALELDDPWEAASKVSEATADTSFQQVDSTPEPGPATGPVGEGDSLVCTAFVPEAVDPGDMFVVRVCIHTSDQSGHPLLESPHDRREANMLARKVARGQPIAFTLSLPGLELDADRFALKWNGEPDSVEFGVVVPFDQSTSTVRGMLAVRTPKGPAGDFSLSIPVR